ncbi:MAG: Sua5/YciO/YrdC/YwlC family protein, partial [Desulfovibrio sp.]|nr:Sua5/YciO/YrdC/YwlC family protein [Desulfovibrio sp.]
MPSHPQSPSPGGATRPQLRRLGLEEAAATLAAGGIVIFPTETLYAIGCRADKACACARLCALKGRPQGSPLPLLAPDVVQAAKAVRLDEAPRGLIERFWPGPLSLLLPALPLLAPEARNTEGLAALRVTSHPLAAKLAALAGGALTASSANFSGGAPAARADA